MAIPNKVEELKAILLGLIEPTRLEAGVIKYELLQNQSQPTDFTFVQEWEGAAALDTHLASVREQGSKGASTNSLARRINSCATRCPTLFYFGCDRLVSKEWNLEMVADSTVGSLILLTGTIGRCLRWAGTP